MEKEKDKGEQEEKKEENETRTTANMYPKSFIPNPVSKLSYQSETYTVHSSRTIYCLRKKPEKKVSLYIFLYHSSKCVYYVFIDVVILFILLQFLLLCAINLFGYVCRICLRDLLQWTLSPAILLTV